ncbi:protein kinase domain-containing protein [Actinomyces viscosus]|uniref:protein kinase domain-containing protein n=1 Tax=Actinomyces viscosus TaxID=1656 RepID=UPI001E3A9C65|nr:protein kinase [Actinomyces viscosus]
MSSTTRPHPPGRSFNGGVGDQRPRRRPVPRRRGTRAPRASRLPVSDAEPSIPDSALSALSQQGYTVGEVMGRSTAPSAPRRGLDAQGRHVVIRVVDLPHGRGGAAVLRRLADLRVLRHPGLVTVREVVHLPEHRVGVITDLVDGAGLDVVLGARGRLSVSHLATLLDVLGSALAYLHEHGTAHGDVSAGNVVVTTEGCPVLIDLLGSVMETGTQDCAAPERLAGAPPSAPSDVYALARLLGECAGQSGSGARRLTGLLTDALAEDPDDRPRARDLAARAPQLGQGSPIELPDGARLAAGSLRAAARTPTRTVGSRRRPGARSGAAPSAKAGPRKDSGGHAPKSRGGRSGRGPAAIRWGRRRGVRRGWSRTWGLAAVLLVAVCLAAWGPARGLASLRPAWALGAASSSTTSARPGASAVSGAAPSAGSSPTAARSASTTASVPGVAEDGAADLVSVVVALSSARDRALMAADAGALAATTVPSSPAAQADTQVLNDLIESGERVEGLQTSVSQVTEVELPDDAAALWPSARAVRVTLSQSASTRSGPSGTRTVPALDSRQVVLVLVPEPWRVADIRSAP